MVCCACSGDMVDLLGRSSSAVLYLRRSDCDMTVSLCKLSLTEPFRSALLDLCMTHYIQSDRHKDSVQMVDLLRRPGPGARLMPSLALLKLNPVIPSAPQSSSSRFLLTHRYQIHTISYHNIGSRPETTLDVRPLPPLSSCSPPLVL